MRLVLCALIHLTYQVMYRARAQTCTLISADNGIITPLKAQYNNNDQITITCNIGYYLSLQINTVTCVTGTWQPNPPGCLRYECPASVLNFPNMATVSSAPYYFSSRPVFTCNQHYIMSTLSTLECAENTWTGTAPYCADIECTPIDVPNAGESLTADPLIHEEQIRIRCDYGYRQDGDIDLTCDTSSGVGALTGVIPICTRIICDAVSVQFGSYLPLAPYYVGSEVSFSCNVGYVLQGAQRLTCLDTGGFDSSPPTCSPVECEEPAYPDMFIISTGPFYYNDGVRFQCAVGYYMTTAANLRCDPDGNWEGVSPFCTKIRCTPPLIAYSTFTTIGPYYDGDKLGVVCDYKYLLQGVDILECDARTQPGQWKETTPVCEVIICTPVDITHGFYDTTSGGDGPPYLLDESIYYECTAGYRLEGNSILTCTADRSWDIPEPVCVRSECLPVSVDRATITTSSPYYWNDVITYTCDQGYNMSGSASISCGSSGEWTDSPPVCKRNVCTTIPIAGGIITSDAPYYMDDVIFYTCKASYYMVGSDVVTCNQHGRYSTSPPVCKLITCAPYQPLNATYLQSSPFYVGDEITYHCKYGLALEGSNTLICSSGEDNSADGVWIGREPRCVNADLRPFEDKKNKAWIAAVVLGALLALALTLLLFWLCCRRQKRKIIKRVVHHTVQKPARQSHHKSCKCASCTKSRHHVGCKCSACVNHETYKRHDEFRCRQCKTAYLHSAASEVCFCTECKKGRQHKLDYRCQCESCQISHNHMAGVICDCKNCNKTVKHVETNTECNCNLCSVYKEHQASKRWEHTKSCHSCRVSFEHDKQHVCTCRSCVTMRKHESRSTCHCEDCDSADIHRLHANCLCDSCVKMEPQIHRVKHHYEHQCQCSACTAPCHHHHHQTSSKSCTAAAGSHCTAIAGSHCNMDHCASRSCSRVAAADRRGHHHQPAAAAQTMTSCTGCDICVPKPSPKPTLQHCECSKCATAREYNHKNFCECPMCTTAHQHTHTNECSCQQCTFFLQYGGHASCVTCQDPSVPMQAMQCTDKNCRRCGVVTSPVVSTSPHVRDEVMERSPRRQLEQPRDTGPKVDCWRPAEREAVRKPTNQIAIMGNKTNRSPTRSNRPVPLNQRPLWLPHKNDVRLDAWHRNSITN